MTTPPTGQVALLGAVSQLPRRLVQGDQCPPGMTEIRPRMCMAPEFPVPSIVDYRPKSTLVAPVNMKPTPKYQPFGESLIGPPEGESPEANVVRRERTGTIERALGRLPADARLAMLLSSQGFHGEEIAAAIGRSHAATRTLLTRARIQLRQDLAGEDLR